MKFVEAKYYTKGRGNKKIEYIVIHYTANTGNTATANGNANYFKNCPRKASAHYVVDEKEVIQCVKDADTAYAVGDSGKGILKGKCTNQNSISIEMVSHTDVKGDFYIPTETLQKTVALICKLMYNYNVPIDKVVRHYDVTAKMCPKPLVNASEWSNFTKRVTMSDYITKDYLATGDTNEVSEWAKIPMEWCKAMGITDGKNPKGYMTREMMCTMLYRFQRICGGR